jgi:hypothetical protein
MRIARAALAGLCGIALLEAACEPREVPKPPPADPAARAIDVDPDDLPCANIGDEATFAMIRSARTWPAIHRASRCSSDDGVFGELFAEAISQMLVDHWDEISELQERVRKDDRLHGLVLRHLDETLPRDEARAIRERARHRCPRAATLICFDILQAIKASALPFEE